MEMRPVRNADYSKTAEIQVHQDRSEGRMGAGGVGRAEASVNPWGWRVREQAGLRCAPVLHGVTGGPCERETTEQKCIWGEDSEFSFSIICKLGPISRWPGESGAGKRVLTSRRNTGGRKMQSLAESLSVRLEQGQGRILPSGTYRLTAMKSVKTNKEL